MIICELTSPLWLELLPETTQQFPGADIAVTSYPGCWWWCESCCGTKCRFGDADADAISAATEPEIANASFETEYPQSRICAPVTSQLLFCFGVLERSSNPASSEVSTVE